MANRFYFGDDSHAPPHATTSDDEDTTTLPFPQPLSRPSFLAADFEPHSFLAGLSSSNRFQTLEDLQTELRDLSTKINKELVDLVNENYEEFLRLGAELHGGEERVEEVRVGLLGFEKDVTMLRERVLARRGEVVELVRTKKELRRDIGIGRGLLDVDERVAELEFKVGLKQRETMVVVVGGKNVDAEHKWSQDWDEEIVDESDEEYNEEDEGISGRIKILVEKFMIIKLLVKKYGTGHPFLVAQRERIQRVQDRIRIEIETAIKGANQVVVKQKLIQMRAQLEE